MDNKYQTELVKLQEQYDKLAQSEKMYRIALSLTDHVVSVIDIPNRSLLQVNTSSVSNGLSENLPETVQEVPESIINQGLIHPEDEDGYRSFFKLMYAGVPRGDFIVRAKDAVGRWAWYKMSYRTMFDEEGKPLWAIAFSDDITTRKKAELMYEQYRGVVTRDASYVWEACLDEDVLVEEDPASYDLFRLASFSKYSDVIEAAMNLVTPEYVDAVRGAFSREYLLGEYAKARREITLTFSAQRPGNTSVHWMETTAYITATPEGTIHAIICARDITDRRRAEEELRAAAEQDGLCGLYNRKAFEYRVANMLITDRRVRRGYLFMVDLDDFKKYNDQYGHQMGDEILRGVSEALKRCFRKDDLLGRFGGDEFMAFAPNITHTSALERAQELNEYLRELSKAKELDRPATISVGIAEVDESDDFESLYRKSDEALYMAKSRGKSCSVVWES